MAKPYLHRHHRFKNGKDHCYWSIAEKVKTRRGWIQRHLLYLGEINESQKASWTKATEVFDPVLRQTRELALYPADRIVPEHAAIMACRCNWINSSCVGPVNGALAGWPADYGINS